MKLITGLIGAVVGGVIGAAIWAAVVKFSGWEIGLIAWGIGGLVGLGFRIGAKDLAHPLAGVVAAAVALLAVLGGKYAVVHIYTQEFLHEMSAEVVQSDEFVLSCVADGVIEEWYAEGREVTWPDGIDPDDAMAQADYPPEAWAESQRRWGAMSPEDQESYRADIFATYGVDPTMGTAMSIEVFFASFGLFDLLWIFLAVGTAFRLGASSDASA